MNAKGDPLPIYRELVSLYSQPQRHYHNLRHLAECLAELDSTRFLAREPIAVELAIWLHDAIYDTHAQDNEVKSAGLARQLISRAGANASLGAPVCDLIRSTQTHDPSAHPDAPLLVDMDLSILGQPEERFGEYETQIRREYDWVPESTFISKRAEILERFMARDRIYTTDPFFAKYEQKARANLRESLRRLKGGGQVRQVLDGFRGPNPE